MDRVKFIAQKRTTLKARLTAWQNAHAQSRFDKVGLKLRFDRITELFRAYEELHDELAILEPENEILNEIARLVMNMNDVEPSTVQVGNVSLASSTMIERQRRAKLPVTELPKFDGNIQNWLSYRNSFLSMIDTRPDISDLEKFIYLRDSLRGEALTKVSVLDVSADNYKLAWDLLKENYEKKRIIIVHKHFDCILDLPKLSKPTYKDLSKLVDDVRQHINVLKH
ncbi:uncharacterized protein LOC128873576 [Hylaeus volcanicus]|uniref:uncharacterized protein LOC128873576 n=1 Tax=Hylaeus volcanicus TaxID=313075 RepID=UPI0023B8494F|nr:uncharacterized protein LOC128873576 [Hylaeus volcanicus]